MPAHTGRVPAHGANAGNELGESRRLGGVSHRADRIDQIRVEPATPVLEPVLERVLGIGRRCRGHLCPGPFALDCGREPAHERRQPRTRKLRHSAGNASG